MTLPELHGRSYVTDVRHGTVPALDERRRRPQVPR